MSLPVNLKIYNIWHQRLFPELLREVPPADRKDIVLFGVNEKIEKELPDVTGDPDFQGFQLAMEYDLPVYQPIWQAQAYCQTSCMYHLHLHLPENRDYSAADYIGFMQYDMKLFPDTLRLIREGIAQASAAGKRIIFHDLTLPLGNALGPYRGGWNEALASYNAFFGTDWTWEQIMLDPRLSSKLPVLHTFVIPTAMFHKMMSWLNPYLRSITGPTATHPYPTSASQAEYAERLHGLFLCLEMAAPDVEMVPLRLAHEWPHYHNEVPYDHYKVRMDD